MTLCCLGPAPAAAEETPRWPLDLPERYLTSNFMEYRPGRFHAGLDLKTQSRAGFPVHAVEDGWIERIRTSAGGYGKALYLRGKSGQIYVYAHLQRFNDELDSQLRKTQLRRSAYSVSMSLGTKHPVSRGELLALSGQSGTLGPHLHFEVRNAANQPVDPQLHGFPVPDRLPPRITRIRVHPAAPRTRIEGDVLARSWSTGAPLTGNLPDVRLEGPVAFSLEVADHADIRRHVLEPSLIRVNLDDSLVFSARNRVYDFNETGLMCLEWLVQPGRRERWLYRRDGNTLPERRGAAWSLDPTVMTPGIHRIDLAVADAAGNETAIAWRVIVGGESAPDVQTSWSVDPARVDVPAGDGLPGGWLSPFLAGSSLQTALTDSGNVAFPVFRSQVRRLSPSPQQVRDALSTQGLDYGDYMAQVHCADWSVDVPLVLDLGEIPQVTGTDLPFWAIYRLRDNGDWVFAGDLQGQGGRLTCGVDRPGVYALFRDRDRPYLGPGPDEGLVARSAQLDYPGLKAPVWETVAIGLEDRGSGIADETLQVRLDDCPLIAEPDLPRHRLLLNLPDGLAAGRHEVSIRVADRAGNIATRQYVLQLDE